MMPALTLETAVPPNDCRSDSSRVYSIVLYVSINLRGPDACWYPMCRDIALIAIPRIGEALCLREQDYFERMTVKDVAYAESGVIIIEVDGEEFDDDQPEFETSKQYHHDLGFMPGFP